MNCKNTDIRFSILAANELAVTGLAKQLNYSVDDLLSAVQEVTFNVEDVEEYIRDRTNRSSY